MTPSAGRRVGWKGHARIGRRHLWGAGFVIASVLVLFGLGAWGVSYGSSVVVQAGLKVKVSRGEEVLRLVSFDIAWMEWRSGTLIAGITDVRPLPGTQVDRPFPLARESWSETSSVSVRPLSASARPAAPLAGLFEVGWEHVNRATPQPNPLANIGTTIAWLPAWVPIPPLALIAWFCRRRMLAAPRFGPGRCPACGYDLRATPERCPECGREAEGERAVPQQSGA